MSAHPTTSLLGTAVVLGCTLVVTARAALAPTGPVPRAATSEERSAIAATIAALEPDWEREATQTFPADDWSQSDHFASREAKQMVELAHDGGVRIEDVLRAVDDDLHRHGAEEPAAADDRRARAVPCKPRPVYD